jgi:hypothetical protein
VIAIAVLLTAVVVGETECGWYPVDSAVDANVQNGALYEQGEIPETDWLHVNVPSDATVVRRESSTIRMHSEKGLDWVGHPDEPIGVTMLRSTMGIAIKKHRKDLWIASFGEWDGLEGGALMRIIIEVPENANIRRCSDLSGAVSRANRKAMVDSVPTEAARGWRKVALKSECGGRTLFVSD